MEKISIFNYEIFYLDFLDGNLSEKDASALLSFLDQHPELKMEDEFLPTLNVETIRMASSSEKEQLKQPLFSDQINENNIEYFIIAKAENLLSLEEKERLSAFITHHPIYSATQKQYETVYLEVDKTLVYAHKESLKKKKVLVLWPFISVAASLLLAFLIWNNSQSTRMDSPPIQITEDKTVPSDDSSLEKIQLKENKGSNVNVLPNPIYEEHPQVNNIASKEQLSPKKTLVDSLPVLKTPILRQENQTPVLITYQEAKLHPISNEIDLSPENAPISSAITENEMINPIEPITAFLGKKTNTIIEYKKQDRTESQPKKLFIKIGGFEFYQKRH